MIEKEQLLAELDTSTSELIREFSAFGPGNFNQRPDEGSWSAAMVAEHIFLLETMVNLALQQAETSDRDPSLKIEPVKQALADADRKFTAPGFVQPSSNDKNQDELIGNIRSQRILLKQIVERSNLTDSPAFRHPTIGRMSILEWVWFNIHHGRRHMKQLQTIAEQVK